MGRRVFGPLEIGLSAGTKRSAEALLTRGVFGDGREDDRHEKGEHDHQAEVAGHLLATQPDVVGIDGYNGVIQKQVNLRHAEDSDESEGVTIWDLDADPRAPGIRGQVHIMDLSNDQASDDDLFMRHFRVSDLSRL